MTGNCPHCGALGTPGAPCPACGRHIPTTAETDYAARVARRTWARRRLGELLRADRPFQIALVPGLGRCLVETFDD